MPLVERALQVLERREVRPQLGLLKSTMLQLDSSFSERAYGAGSFTDFIDRLRKNDLIAVTGGEGRYMIQRKRTGAPEKTVRQEEGLTPSATCSKITVSKWKTASPWTSSPTGFARKPPSSTPRCMASRSSANSSTTRRIKPWSGSFPTKSRRASWCILGAEFHPPAIPEPEPPPIPVEIDEEIEEPQPIVPGQPTAGSPRVKKGTRKAPGLDVNGNVAPAPKRTRTKSATPRKRRAPAADA